MNKHARRLAIAATGLMQSLIASTASADFVTTVTSAQTTTPGGPLLYEYTLYNNASSDLSAANFTLFVDPHADLHSISQPLGWRDIGYTSGDGTITWESTGSSFDIHPGGSLVFSFTSILAPSLQDYVTTGISDSPPHLETDGGQIASPGVASIPEPTSMIPLGTGLAAIGGYSLRRRGKAEDHPADSD